LQNFDRFRDALWIRQYDLANTSDMNLLLHALSMPSIQRFLLLLMDPAQMSLALSKRGPLIKKK